MQFKDAVLRAEGRVIATGLKGNIQPNNPQACRFSFPDSQSGPQLLNDLAPYSNAELELPGIFKCRIVVENDEGSFKVYGNIEPYRQEQTPHRSKEQRTNTQ